MHQEFAVCLIDDVLYQDVIFTACEEPTAFCVNQEVRKRLDVGKRSLQPQYECEFSIRNERTKAVDQFVSGLKVNGRFLFHSSGLHDCDSRLVAPKRLRRLICQITKTAGIRGNVIAAAMMQESFARS